MNKKELATLLIAVALIILGFICGIRATQDECYDKGYTVYTIRKNDTIWSIACDTQNDTQSDTDIRKIVYTIRKDNNIENAGALQIGQQILLREEY